LRVDGPHREYYSSGEGFFESCHSKSKEGVGAKNAKIKIPGYNKGAFMPKMGQ